MSKNEMLENVIRTAFSEKEIERIVYFYEDEPFEILGQHYLKSENCIVINAFMPRAKEVQIKRLDDHKVYPMKIIHTQGFFQAIFLNESAHFPYQFHCVDDSGYQEKREDPYTFSTQITDYDLYLVGEGSHYKSYEKFGARECEFNQVQGVHFAVWAPNAKSVSVVGNFNHWTTGEHPMNRIHFSGVWGLFIPALKSGEVYKYAIKSHVDDQVRVKADPYAFQSELRPKTASVVKSEKTFSWQDQDWIEERSKEDMLSAPLSIYEVHLGSWMRDEENGWSFLKYEDLAHEMVSYIKEMGYTHVQLLPIAEHPLDVSWGYQVISYFAPTSRFGTPEGFKYFVNVCHKNGIGVFLDWVPAHFPRDEHGLSSFDGRQIYAYENWKKGEHKEWGTLIFDYGRNEVRNFLISNALFWLDEYHIDGLRVDAVASMLYLDYSRKEGEWEPNIYGGRENLEAVSFLKQFNEIIHVNYPGVLTIAEESTAWPGVSKPTYLGGLGFSMKWNMGWMNDTLEYFSKDPVHRQYQQGNLTFSLLYAFSENFVLPISHDEVVYGKRSLLEKMPGDDWQKFANLRLFFTYMYTHPGKKLMFMGCDMGQRSEWNSGGSLDWHLLQFDSHQKLKFFFKDLNHLYKSNRALFEVDFSAEGFEWIDFSDAASSVISFIRWSWDRQEMVICILNMTPIVRTNYRVGVPIHGFYQEILNSDAIEYGGSGIGNWGGFNSDEIGWHGKPYSLNLNLPPLGGLILRLEKR